MFQKNYLSSTSEYLIAVGSYQPRHSKTELLSLSNTWSVESDYPYGTE